MGRVGVIFARNSPVDLVFKKEIERKVMIENMTNNYFGKCVHERILKKSIGILL